MSTAWYVLQTKPKKENQVYGYLDAQGFDLFYPSVKVKPVNPRSSTIRPLFPRYMFVFADLESIGISSLQWIPNVLGLVQFGGHPATVPDSVIHELKQRVAKLQSMGDLNTHGLKKGDLVQITQGPLEGYEALFDMQLSGAERVQVLLSMLGRLVKVQVDSQSIQKSRRQR